MELIYNGPDLNDDSDSDVELRLYNVHVYDDEEEDKKETKFTINNAPIKSILNAKKHHQVNHDTRKTSLKTGVNESKTKLSPQRKCLPSSFSKSCKNDDSLNRIHFLRRNQGTIIEPDCINQEPNMTGSSCKKSSKFTSSSTSSRRKQNISINDAYLSSNKVLYKKAKDLKVKSSSNELHGQGRKCLKYSRCCGKCLRGDSSQLSKQKVHQSLPTIDISPLVSSSAEELSLQKVDEWLHTGAHGSLRRRKSDRFKQH